MIYDYEWEQDSSNSIQITNKQTHEEVCRISTENDADCGVLQIAMAERICRLLHDDDVKWDEYYVGMKEASGNVQPYEIDLKMEHQKK